MKKDNAILFFILYGLTFSGTVFSKEVLHIDQLLYNSLAERLTSEQISTILTFQNRWEWITYLFLPLYIYLKILFITAILLIGIFFTERTIEFEKLFGIVVKAEFTFLLAIPLKVLWFHLFAEDYTFDDLQNYVPLSLESLLGYENFESWLIYPMQVLNLLEITYWFVLAFLIAKELHINMKKSFCIVASSYGSGLLILIASIMFITLNTY